MLLSFLGYLCLLLALWWSSLATYLGFTVNRATAQIRQIQLHVAVYGHFLCMLAANALMVTALLRHDFAVKYVGLVGSRATPPLYSAVSLWSSLEGSILFWGLILATYTLWFSHSEYHRQPRHFFSSSVGVAMLVASFFGLLLVGPANPFLPIVPTPVDGPGPNALLQNHVLMIIHPPMLYLGYVGLTIPFAVAISSLWWGQLEAWTLALLRRVTLLPWLFLSVGIVLGSWWAYEVLGWGGYWAWDPVENASFLPWLAATGYIHAGLAQERKKVLRTWTLLQVIMAFLLTILGTFMTRSGVFNSVHSFTQSAIGPLFLIFFMVVTLASLMLVLWRAPQLEAQVVTGAYVSREFIFVINNAVFVLFTFVVLLGTVYPLFAEALTNTKVSVGEPYYNRMGLPIGLLMVFLMGIGPRLPWGRGQWTQLWHGLWMPTVAGVCTALVAAVMLGMHQGVVLVTLALVGFSAYTTLEAVAAPAWQRSLRRHENFWWSLWQSLTIARRRTGGMLVHAFILVVVVAICLSQNYRDMVEAPLKVGESMRIGPYLWTYLGSETRSERHRFSMLALMQVSHEGKAITLMKPRLNFYANQREPIATPAVYTFGIVDLYASLMSMEKAGSQVVIRAYRIPAVAWIWRSLPLLVLGGLLTLWPKKSTFLLAPKLPRKL